MGRHKAGEPLEVAGKEYTIERVLSCGTEGETYVVHEQQHRYALKLYRPGYHSNIPVLNALKPLKGKGCIVDFIAFGEDFELMEYFPEGSAAKACARGHAEAVLAIAIQVAEALDAMHKASIIHKDIKPANILIRDPRSWECAVCDFGIADLLDSSGSVVTRRVRTPAYAAPEVCRSYILKEGLSYCELTPKADFYSLGRTLLALWVGEDVFLSQEGGQDMSQVRRRNVLPADLPPPLANICHGLLMEEPERRWGLQEIYREAAPTRLRTP